MLIERGADPRTRILVTNQLQYARPADRILYVAEGRVVESGTYEELMDAEGGFAALMAQTEVGFHPFLLCHPFVLCHSLHCSALFGASATAQTDSLTSWVLPILPKATTAVHVLLTHIAGGRS